MGVRTVGNVVAHACPARWTGLQFSRVPWALLAPSGGTNCTVQIHGGKIEDEHW